MTTPAASTNGPNRSENIKKKERGIRHSTIPEFPRVDNLRCGH